MFRIFTQEYLLKVRLAPSKKVVFVFSTESLVKNMKKAFYFILKALFVLKILTYLSWLFGYAEKQLAKKATGDFKIYEVTNQTTDNYNTHIA